MISRLFNKLLCLIGYHQWEVFHYEGNSFDFDVWRCPLCGKQDWIARLDLEETAKIE